MENITESNNQETQNKTGMKKAGYVILVILWVVLFTGAVFLGRLISWVFHNWANLKMDELKYTLSASTEGANPEIYSSAVAYVLPYAIAAAVAAIIVFLIIRKHKKFCRIFLTAGSIIAAAAIVGLFAYFGYRIGFFSYVKNQNTESSFIEENYVDPENVELTFPEKKRNLIFLYIESMEASFTDAEHGGGKPENVIPELTDIAIENEDFSGESDLLNGGYALYGSTYTMGGIFAQSAGLPLTVSNGQLTLSEGFLPGITAVGDILEEAGYKNIFCLGTEAAFAERDAFFRDHGNFELLDYRYSVENGEIPEDYGRPWWGYDDYILYENAKKHLTETAATGQPFNFTMLTVDTHAEDGYMCDICEDRFGDDTYSNAMDCASAQAADFLEWVQQQDFYENTTVIIVGDHCTMDSDYANDMPEDYQRKIYSVYINSAVEPESNERREYSSMDNFPTTLASLGVKIDGERLGLGTNLFSGKPTLVEELGKDELDKNLQLKSDFLDNELGAPIDTKRDSTVEYNDDTGCIELRFNNPLDYDGEFAWIFCDVTNEDTGDTARYRLSEDGEAPGIYFSEMSLEEFDLQPGSYKMDVYIFLQDGLPKWYSTEHIDVDKVRFVPSVVNTVITEDGAMEMSYVPKGKDDFKNHWFAVWSDENGQDDVFWYGSEKQEDAYVTTIDLKQHATEGTLSIHVYGGRKEPKEVVECMTVDASTGELIDKW